MGQRLLHRRLASTSARIRELENELRILDDQKAQLVDEANELSLRALVSETPGAEFEYRQVKKHADVLVKRHSDLKNEIAELHQRLDQLLDRMKGASA